MRFSETPVGLFARLQFWTSKIEAVKKYIIRRIILMIPLVIGVTTATFALARPL